jgi:hypothetical protein
MALTSQLLLFSHTLYAYVFEIVTLYNNLFKSHIQYSLRPKKNHSRFPKSQQLLTLTKYI